MPGFLEKIKKELEGAASGFKKLGADVMDDGKVNRSTYDKMGLIQLMKKGADVPKESDDEKARKDKAVSEGMKSARERVFRK